MAECADIFKADFSSIICEQELSVWVRKAETLEIAAKIAHYGAR